MLRFQASICPSAYVVVSSDMDSGLTKTMMMKTHRRRDTFVRPNITTIFQHTLVALPHTSLIQTIQHSLANNHDLGNILFTVVAAIDSNEIALLECSAVAFLGRSDAFHDGLCNFIHLVTTVEEE